MDGFGKEVEKRGVGLDWIELVGQGTVCVCFSQHRPLAFAIKSEYENHQNKYIAPSIHSDAPTQ
jgi:hypothetical protein